MKNRVMKRKEEIEQKAHELSEIAFPYGRNIWAHPNLEAKVVNSCCISIAEWADETMKNKLIAELTKLRDNAIEEMRKDKTTSTPDYYSACGQAHAYVQVMNIIYENF